MTARSDRMFAVESPRLKPLCATPISGGFRDIRREVGSGIRELFGVNYLGLMFCFDRAPEVIHRDQRIDQREQRSRALSPILMNRTVFATAYRQLRR